MEMLIALLIGFLFAASIFCLLRRSIFRLVIGLMLLSQAANLLVFSSGGLVVGESAIIPGEENVLAATAADPLPQALVLTAIVIGFGVLAFAIALVYRSAVLVDSPDLDAFDTTEGKP